MTFGPEGRAAKRMTMRSLSPQKILIVDDDTEGAERLALLVEVIFGHAEIVPNAYEALSLLAEKRFDAIVTEFVLPGAGGVELLERSDPGIPAFVVTAVYSEPVAARSRAAGARAVFPKPVDADKLIDAIRLALTGPRVPAAVWADEVPAEARRRSRRDRPAASVR